MNTKRRTLPFSVRRRLAALRWSIRAYVVIETIAVLFIWLALTYWASLALDYLPVLAGASEMPRGFRAGALVATAAVLAWLLWRWLPIRMLLRLTNTQMAVLLERRFPVFRDALLTVVELAAHPDHAEEFNEAMLDETGRAALEAIPRIRLRHVFRFRPLGLKIVAALALAGSIGVFAQMSREAFALSIRRLYLLEDVRWPRRTRIRIVGIRVQRSESSLELAEVPDLRRFENRTLKVAKGADVVLLVEADARKSVPQRCFIYYRTPEGDSGRLVMRRVGNIEDGVQRFEFDGRPFRGILNDLEFDVRGGDHRVRGYRLDVVNSPVVAKAELACVFPDYLVDRSLSLWTPRTVLWQPGLELPRGTQVTCRLQSSKPLRWAEVVWPSPSAETPRRERLVPSANDRTTVVLPPATLQERLALDVILYDDDGVLSDEPYRVVVGGIPDQAPQVQVAIHGIGTAITPVARVPLAGRVTDDYGVDDTWCEIEIEGRGTRRFPLSLREDRVEADVDFAALRNASGQPLVLRPKDRIRLVVRARDRYALESEPHVGSGDPYELDVVTPEELLARLDRRELELRRRFEQIIEEMTQMRDALGRVRHERPEDLAGGAEPGEDAKSETPDPAALAERLRSLNVLRTQRALAQVEKSAGEVTGVAASFADIRLQIENNRVDAPDRKERISRQIVEPLELVVASLFPELTRQLSQLDRALAHGGDVRSAAEAAHRQASEILIELDKVLQKMLELEDYNALVQLVRQLLEQQKALRKRTQKLREQKALELLE